MSINDILLTINSIQCLVDLYFAARKPGSLTLGHSLAGCNRRVLPHDVQVLTNLYVFFLYLGVVVSDPSLVELELVLRAGLLDRVLVANEELVLKRET